MKLAPALPWAAWAAASTLGIGSTLEYQTARHAGLGPLTAAAIALALDYRIVGDLTGVYGRTTALWSAAALAATTGSATLIAHGQPLPVALAAAAAVGTKILTRKDTP